MSRTSTPGGPTPGSQAELGSQVDAEVMKSRPIGRYWQLHVHSRQIKTLKARHWHLLELLSLALPPSTHVKLPQDD